MIHPLNLAFNKQRIKTMNHLKKSDPQAMK
ncbi:hypothetical protein [Enterococcus avium]